MLLPASLIPSLLIASAAVADRSRVPQPRASQRRPYYPFGGAMILGPPGTFYSISGEIKVPQILPGPDTNASVYITVSLGSVECEGNFLQTGIVMGDDRANAAFYRVSHNTSERGFDKAIQISHNDTVRMTVSMPWNSTSGIVGVENLTTGQNVAQYLNFLTPLCQHSAEWFIVALHDLANFGKVSFTHTGVEGNGGPFGLQSQGVSIHDIYLTSQEEVQLTFSSVDGSSLTVQYIGVL